MVVIDYILGSLFRIAFFAILIVFHPIQVVIYNTLGIQAHQNVVQLMNGCIVAAFRLAGTRTTYDNPFALPISQPSIVIANHQSLWDIVGIYWYLRKINPLFVSKIELAKGIPSISYNLRKSGAAIIERKNRKQAIAAILDLGHKISEEKRAAVIFPEGTRSITGELRQFSHGGIAGLLKKSPDAVIIPIAIEGTGAMVANKFYRIKAFKKVKWSVLEPFPADGLGYEAITLKCRNMIKDKLEGQA